MALLQTKLFVALMSFFYLLCKLAGKVSFMQMVLASVTAAQQLLAQKVNTVLKIPPLLAMMEVRNSWELKMPNGKWIHVPSSLVETFEGKTFLRFRPTHPTIASLVMGEKYKKNASLAASPNLQDLLKSRNQAASADPEAEEEEKEDLFGQDADSKDASKKRKVPAGCYIVNIMAMEKEITCLVFGRRPSKTDLLVEMDPEQLSAVVDTLQLDIDLCLGTNPRAYKRAAHGK